MRTEHRYEVVIYWSGPDGAFVATVPELPGCAADGATQADALRNVGPVITAWLNTASELGRDIPKPRERLQHA